MIRARAHVDGARVTGLLDLSDTASSSATTGDTRSAHWRLPGDDSGHVGDALAVTALLPAMALGSDLELEWPVDPVLLERLDTVQDVFCTWSRRKQRLTGSGPTYRRIEVAAAETEPAPPSDERVTALMFSGGVDSFYSVLSLGDRVDVLVFVHGLDVRLDDPVRDAVAGQVRAAAEQLGLPLLEVETDVRALTDPLAAWEDTHGAALAAVGHLLADRVATVVVPATLTYDALYPLGSHPLVDPLWGSTAVRMVHHGAEADRVAKMAAIASSPAARRWLRVCPRYDGGTENCGRCEKCLRTMTAARLAGADGVFATLPRLHGVRDLARVATVRTKGRATTWTGYWDLTREEVHDPSLRWATGAALARHHLRVAAQRRTSRRR